MLQGFPLFWNASGPDVVPQEAARGGLADALGVKVEHAGVLLRGVGHVASEARARGVAVGFPDDPRNAEEQFFLNRQGWIFALAHLRGVQIFVLQGVEFCRGRGEASFSLAEVSLWKKRNFFHLQSKGRGKNRLGISPLQRGTYFPSNLFLLPVLEFEFVPLLFGSLISIPFLEFFPTHQISRCAEVSWNSKKIRKIQYFPNWHRIKYH